LFAIRESDQALASQRNSNFRLDCPAIDGIIDEAEDVTGEVADKDVLDAAIIAAGQAVEHYEITRYGSLIAGRSALAITTSLMCSNRL